MPVDIELGGVYLPPLAQALLLAFGVLRLVWHEALFEGALYACLCAGLILLMGALH